MPPNPRRQDARLNALYDQIPAIDCQGFCHDSCGPIDMSVRERQRMEKQAGQPVTCGIGASCSMLTPDRKCGVYDVRPMICRVWGVVETMKCPYGCKPERYLTNEEAARLIGEADIVGGHPHGREARLRQTLEDHQAVLDAATYLVKHAKRPTIHGRADALDGTTGKPMIERPAQGNERRPNAHG